MKYLKPFVKIFNKKKEPKMLSMSGAQVSKMLSKITENNPNNQKLIIDLIGETEYKKAYSFFSKISSCIKKIDFDHIKDLFLEIEDKYEYKLELHYCYHYRPSSLIYTLESEDPNVLMVPYLKSFTYSRPIHAYIPPNFKDFEFGIYVGITNFIEEGLDYKECIKDIKKFIEGVKLVTDHTSNVWIDNPSKFMCRAIIYLNF